MRRATSGIAAGILAALVSITALPAPAHADEVRDGQWYLDAFDIGRVHELSQGAGVTIGVIDTGIDASHPDLEGNVLPGTDLATPGGDGLLPVSDHGTAVASVLNGHGHGAGNDDGVLGIAPKAKIVSVNVFGSGSPATDPSLVSQGIHWLADHGVDIISISLGSSGGVEGNEAVRYANDKGIPVVVGTGNRYLDVGFGPEEQSGSGWGSNTGTIPVTGTTKSGEFWDNSLDLTSAAKQPQFGLSAPAIDIPTAMPDGGYDTKKGTSFSAPIVAGTLALIKSAYPDLDYNQWIDRLLDTVDDKGPENYDVDFGWGIVNPLRSLTEETTYTDSSGDRVSSPDDRLTLEEQGKDSGDEPAAPGTENPAASSDSDQALTGQASGIPLWAIAAAVAAIAVTITIAIVLVVRRRKTRQGLPAQLSVPPGAFPQPPSGPPHQ